MASSDKRNKSMTKYGKYESDGLWPVKKMGWTTVDEMNGIDEYGYLRGWYIKSTLYTRFLNWNKILEKKKVVTGKTLFFVIGPFCTPRSICFNICFW